MYRQGFSYSRDCIYSFGLRARMDTCVSLEDEDEKGIKLELPGTRSQDVELVHYFRRAIPPLSRSKVSTALQEE